MKILLLGSSGMLGQSLLTSHWAAQHQWIAVSRTINTPQEGITLKALPLDLNHPYPASFWIDHLNGVDIIINCLGIIRETDHQHFQSLHHLTPKYLFEAAAQTGVRHIIQVSALGAEKAPEALFSQYHKTKQAADRSLATLSVPYTILYPSLILSPQGASTTLFTQLASLPITSYPNIPALLQPVSSVDVIETIEKLIHAVAGEQPRPKQLILVGSTTVTMRSLLGLFKKTMELPRFMIPIPAILNTFVAELGERCSLIPLNREMWQMLQAGNASDDQSMSVWLQRPPTPLNIAIEKATHSPTNGIEKTRNAYLHWGLVFIWIWTAGVSIVNYNEGYRLMANLHLPLHGQFWIYPFAIYGGALLDLLIGIGIALRKRSALWISLITMLIYSTIVTIYSPYLWFDPLGAISKNIPIALITWSALLGMKKRNV